MVQAGSYARYNLEWVRNLAMHQMWNAVRMLQLLSRCGFLSHVWVLFYVSLHASPWRWNYKQRRTLDAFRLGDPAIGPRKQCALECIQWMYNVIIHSLDIILNIVFLVMRSCFMNNIITYIMVYCNQEYYDKIFPRSYHTIWNGVCCLAPSDR